MNIELIPVLKDNYAYLLLADDGTSGIVDPGEAEPIIRICESRNITPDFILNTHHHGDHIAGNAELKEKYGCRIAGPAAEEERIGGLDILLREGDMFQLGSAIAKIIETPGHTRGHICFYFAKDAALFCGDTLFAMGCGRLFEGTAEQMWDSLSKLIILPADTRVYCGHEYTLANGEFCLKIEPENHDIKKRVQDVRRARQNGAPTIPSSIELEKKTNSFLRAGSAERFAEIRRLKDGS